MPAELENWDSGYGWHEREGLWYIVVREPKLQRIMEDVAFAKRTVWLKKTSGWVCTAHQEIWIHLDNPRKPVLEWIERGVWIFELGISKSHPDNIARVAAALDSCEIDVLWPNACSWHNTHFKRKDQFGLASGTSVPSLKGVVTW